ncbi:anti-sigma factor family protein [Cellulomonas hominis]
MNHLGARISALADGQLPPAAAERALAHVALCPQCAQELAGARQARRVLTGADDVLPTADLTARLLSLGCLPPQPPASHRDPFVPPSGRRVTSGRGAAVFALHAGALTGDVAPRRPALRIAAGSLAGLGAVAAALFVLGEQPSVVPSTQPSLALSRLGEAATGRAASTAAMPVGTGGIDGTGGTVGTSGALTLEDSLAWIRSEGWTCPSTLPDGWSITSVRLLDSGTVLEVDLSGPVGELVVTEQRGRLDTEALDGLAHRTVGDRTVYVLSTLPWHIAWQSGDIVVEVVSASGSSAVESVVAKFPADGFDGGVPARITRGWDALAAAVMQS